MAVSMPRFLRSISLHNYFCLSIFEAGNCPLKRHLEQHKISSKSCSSSLRRKNGPFCRNIIFTFMQNIKCLFTLEPPTFFHFYPFEPKNGKRKKRKRDISWQQLKKNFGLLFSVSDTNTTSRSFFTLLLLTGNLKRFFRWNLNLFQMSTITLYINGR